MRGFSCVGRHSVVVPRLRDIRDLIWGRIPSGVRRMRYLMSSTRRQADCCFCPVQVCDRPLCQGRITQFLVEIHLDGPTRLGDMWFPKQTQPACQS